MAGKLALGINVLLAIAVIYLFTTNHDHTSTEPTSTDEEVTQPEVSDDGMLKVALIREDSILNNYNYVIEEGKRLEQRASQKSIKFQQELQEYQNEVARWEGLLAQKQDKELY
ncbi:MAG: hypothetical protein HKN32_03420, partial [Flavobacteriales bacterium]|nr:hypothetical protein [Flavobacteriales bacterium]